MRFKSFFTAAAATLALSACNPLTLVPVPAAAAPMVDKVVLEGTRAFTLAEIAYNGAATSANEVAKACIALPSLPCPITPSLAGQLRVINTKATRALQIGYQAQGSAERAAQAENLFEAAEAIKGLLPSAFKRSVPQ